MKIFVSSFTFLSLLLLTTLAGYGQQTFKLNTINNQSKQVSAKTVSGTEQLRQYYNLNGSEDDFSLLRVGDFIEMEVTPGSAGTFLVDRIESYTPITRSFITRDVNNPENTFTFTYSEGRVHGIYHKAHDDVYFFEYDRDSDQNYVAKSSPVYDEELFCSIHELGEDSPQTEAFRSFKKGPEHESSPSTHPSKASMLNSLDDEITIDVLIPYTVKAKNWAESTSFRSIDVVISSAMANSQTALDNSNTGVKLRLVHYYQTNYIFDSAESLSSSDDLYVSAGDHLRRLTRDDDNPFDFCSSDDISCEESDYNGYFPQAHQLRDQYGADIVAAVLSEPNTGGIAWVNSSTTGSPRLAFSINRVQQIGTNYTLIHEIGHNMGNSHARNQPNAGAGEFGGLFVYSVGNRFSTTDFDYATVMAYSDGGYAAIPYFSSPDILFGGEPTGNPITSNLEAGPSDNARSMREIKRVIASYRPSVVDAPSADVGVSSISANLNQDDQTVTVPVTISNSGSSDLMWDFDFDIESGVIASKSSTESAKVVFSDPEVTAAFSPGSSSEFLADDDDGTVYATSFESGEGFTLGDSPARAGWRSFSTSTPFEISSDNPSDGSRHLRLPRRSESSGSMFSRSPFFGPQPMGEFSISFDIATQDQIIENTGETFDVYVFDGSNGAISSGLIITGGNIFARSLNGDGEGTFSFTGSTFPTDGTYQSMEIRYNPNNRSVDYYLEGIQIASNPYPGGRKPDYMYFGQRNEISGAYMDVDNIRVERLHSPFDWLTTESFGGVIAPGESETVNLTLSAVDVATGDYSTVLQVRSNDPANPVIEVPVSASIEMATSSEVSTQDLPQRPELAQNYPNPFNPTTTIQFTLNQASDVTLEVFNITGQRVATLVNSTLSAGSHQHTFDASGLSSGIYMYRLRTPGQTLTRQMILIK